MAKNIPSPILTMVWLQRLTTVDRRENSERPLAMNREIDEIVMGEKHAPRDCAPSNQLM